MSQFTNYAENAIINHIRGGPALAQPAGLWVRLHTGAPGEDATANGATNSTRVQGTFGAPTDGISANTAVIEWATVPATETYSHVSIWDASTGGNPLYHGAMSAPVAVTAGQPFRFNVGQLTIGAA